MNKSHPKATDSYSDEWLTDPRIIKRLGQFDLDPCSPVNRPCDTALNHLTILDDGLKHDWYGRVWCNPPYSVIEKFMRKLAMHENGIALVFARTETKWFFKYVWEKADSIFFFKSRLNFFNVEGVRAKGNGGAPSVLIGYGKNNVEAIDSCGIEGKHVRLNYIPLIVVGVSPTWFSIVTIATKHYGDGDLKPVYDMVERIAPDKIANNQHWKAKVRQQIHFLRKKDFSINTLFNEN